MRRERLRTRGVIDGICHKKNRRQAELYPYQVRWNKIVSKVRALVEHPFARVKRMRFTRVRYRGLRRNEVDFALNLIAHNLRRALSLTKTA